MTGSPTTPWDVPSAAAPEDRSPASELPGNPFPSEATLLCRGCGARLSDPVQAVPWPGHGRAPDDGGTGDDGRGGPWSAPPGAGTLVRVTDGREVLLVVGGTDTTGLAGSGLDCAVCLQGDGSTPDLTCHRCGLLVAARGDGATVRFLAGRVQVVDVPSGRTDPGPTGTGS